MATYVFQKNGDYERAKGLTDSGFNVLPYGEVYTYSPNFTPFLTSSFTSSEDFSSTEYRKLKSLKNIINKKSAVDDVFNFDSILNVSCSIIGISSVYLGSGIEKGTVSLNYYVSGAILDQARDNRENGVLYNNSDEKIGFVLYEHGFIILTSSAPITPITYGKFKDQATAPATWTRFTCLTGSEDFINTSIAYNCLNNVPTITVLVEAQKGLYNHSNNSTYIESGSYSATSTKSSFIESNNMSVKKTNKSPFVSGSAVFDKQTFITKIGLYDEEKKLIGVASLANPIRKTENREFLFKLQIDI
jgi:hypothetical protein